MPGPRSFEETDSRAKRAKAFGKKLQIPQPQDAADKVEPTKPTRPTKAAKTKPAKVVKKQVRSSKTTTNQIDTPTKVKDGRSLFGGKPHQKAIRGFRFSSEVLSLLDAVSAKTGVPIGHILAVLAVQAFSSQRW